MPKKSDLHDCFVPYVIFHFRDSLGVYMLMNSEELKNYYEHPLAMKGWHTFPLIIAN